MTPSLGNPSKLSLLLALAIGVALGALASAALMRPSPSDDSALNQRLEVLEQKLDALSGPREAPSGGGHSASAFVGRAELSTLLDEKLKMLMPKGAELPKPSPSPEPTQAQQEAFAKSSALIDAGIRAGRWTQADREQLRGSLAGVTPGQREDLMRQLIVAMNEQKLKPEFVGPPF